MVNTSKLSIGIIFLVLGIMFLTVTIGLVPDFSYLEYLRYVWPFGIILSGILIIFRQKTLGFIILMFSVILGIMFVFVPKIENCDVKNTEYYIEFDQVNIDKNNLENLYYNIDYGVGEVNFLVLDRNFSEQYLITGLSKSIFEEDVKYEFEKIDNSSLNVQIYRHVDDDKTFNTFFNENENKLNLYLNPDIETDLELDYGISDVNLDLRGLKIRNLDIEEGISHSHIIFEKYPTNVKINSGITDVYLEFPKDYNIKINVEGGLLDVNFHNFEKKENIYYSPNFNYSNDEIILVNVEAGISSISGGFY